MESSPSRLCWFIVGLLFCRCLCGRQDGCRDLPGNPAPSMDSGVSAG